MVTDSAGADSNTAVVQVAITAINDAPTLSGGPYTWVGTSEDTSSQAVTVSSLLAGVTYADVDGPASGIALTASTGSSVWQYSTDGVTWTDVGAVSNGSALLLSGSTLLRYVPDGKNGGTATLTFRAWDQTFGIASLNGIRSTSDTSSNGGSTAFSTGIAQATISVSSVNDAPVLSPSSPVLNTLTDGDVNNVGQAVSSLITGQVSDVDTGAVQGIAITGLSSGVGGTWQFSLDSGASWQDVGTVSTASALLLRSSDRVRFVPDGVHGTTASFTFKAWDQSGITAGQQGFKLDASSSGGTTPFSLVSDTASVTVVAVNDAPTVTSSGGSAAFVEGADVASTPVVVDSGLTVSDSDSPLLYSALVKITGNLRPSEDVLGFTNDPATMGDISGSYNAATGTMTFTSASGASAAQWQAALRSVTYSNSSDTPDTTTRSVSFSVSDGQLDSADVTRSVTVTAANDSPQLSLPGVISLSEDATGIITGIVVSDVDAGTGNVQVTFTLPANSGILFATVSGNIAVDTGLNTISLTGKVADINAYIAGMNLFYSPNANFNGNVTLGVSITDLGNSGGPAKTDSGSLILQVDAVNDAPSTPVVPLLPVSGSEDVPLVLNGISFSDIDAGSGVVQATFSVAPGSGTFSALAGAGVTLTGSGTNQLVLSGSLSDINAFIAGSQVSYLSAANASGIVIVTVSLNDRGNTGTGGAKVSSATFNLDISPVNDAPVNSVPGAQTVLSNETLVFSAGNGNAISISDVDVAGGNLRVTLVGINGLITLGSISGLSFLAGDGTVDAIMTFDGSLADINNALAGLSFTPMAGYHGAASLQIITNDQGQSGSGGQQTDTDIISINVEQPNPRIVGVSAGTPDGTYKVGDQILVLVEFDQSVSVDTTSGRPSLLLETGTIDRTAQYLGGSGSNVLSFLYTVQAGDQSADLNIAGVGALSLNGARIFNARLDDAFSDLPDPASIDSLASRANLVIDGVAPVVNSVTVPANGTYVAGQNLDFVVNFSENVIVDTSGGTPNILVTLDGGGTVLAQYLSGSGSTALLFRLVVSSGQFDSNGISLGSTIQTGGGTLRDSAGNDINTSLNSVASTTGVLVDAVAPTVSSVSVPAGVPYNAGDTLTFVVNTSEAVLVNGSPRLALDIGGRTVFADLVAGSGTSTLVFQYTVQAGDNDADGISVNGLSANGATLRDAVGNNMNLTLNNVGATSGVIVDTVAPTPSAIVTLDPSPTNAGSVRYTVTFSEGVSGVDLSDFALVGTGTAAGSLIGLQQIDARTYQITVSGVSGTGTLGLNLNGSGTGILDAAGNPLSGGLTGAVYSVDRDAPTVTAVSVPAGSLNNAGDTLEFVVQTSEAVVVDGSPKLAIDMGGRTVYADYVSGSGSNSLVFRYTIQAGDNDADGIQVSGLSANGGSLRDATGNALNPSLNGIGDSHGVLVDTRAPTATGVVRLDPSPTGASTVNFLVTFDEDVSGVDAGDFSLVTSNSASGSILSVVQVDARIYRVTVGSVSGQGSLGLAVNAGGISDAAGNALANSLRGDSYVIGSLSDGDPEFRVTTPGVPALPSPTPLQPDVPVVVTPQGTSPVLPPSLFPSEGTGGLPPLGNIFVNNGAPSQSFIAQAFGSSSFGDGSGKGFLGFGGGDAGVFGSSTLAGIFDSDGFDDSSPLKAFDRRSGDIDQGIRGIFGAPSLTQQLQQIHESEQQPLRELAWALGQVAQDRDAS
ncbi:beta strand repeat-containing protein [Pseudomonas denitrificans (nom. rej.)]|uniref:beta strand repeat-containing protein n=1 Tax=Pseudomonas denitrificans TaxID=43306 RepID=UPI003F4AAE27